MNNDSGNSIWWFFVGALIMFVWALVDWARLDVLQ